jgi:hypothetical protein
MTATAVSPQPDGPYVPPVERPDRLTPDDLAAFQRLGIPPDLLDEAHVRRISDREARADYGIVASATADLSGIVFPYFSLVTGRRVTARLRRDNPEIEAGREKNKYLSAYGDRKHLYPPPGAADKLRDAYTPIVFVESEKGCLALTAWANRRGLNLLAVGLGGCWGWRGRIGKAENANGERVDELGPIPDLDCANGRRVYVLLDANSATNQKVQQAEAGLVSELQKRNSEVLLCDLPTVDGVNGPDDYIGVCGDEAMAMVLTECRTSGSRVAAGDRGTWPDPEPLGGELPAVQPFDLVLLPESLRPLVKDVSERMQVPMDYPAVAAVLCIAGVTNRRATIQPKAEDTSWVVVPNLWGGMIAPPGLMKSPVISAMTQPLTRIEALWFAEHESAINDYRQQKEEAELRQAAWREQYKSAQKKGKPAPLRPDDSIAEPLCGRLITQDATAEKLHEIMRDNPAGVLVIRDELSGWLATLDKQGREGERGFFLSAWNGDTPYTIDRIGRGSIRVEACCVSMLGGIQPARLRRYLRDAVQDGPLNDGLFQRFQVLVYPDISSEWHYVDRPPAANAFLDAQETYNRLVQLDAAQPLRLRFDPASQDLFVDWLTDLESKLRRVELHPALISHLAKYRKLMPSLALLFELADGGLSTVSLAHARQAAAFCEYLESHARRIYSMIISPERQAAAELGRHLATGWKCSEGIFAVRDVYRNEWRDLGTPEAVRRALPFLHDAGWIMPAEAETRPGEGRPSEMWLINPKLQRKAKR